METTVTMEQLTAALTQANKDGFTQALAAMKLATPVTPAPVNVEPPAVSDRVMAEINGLFQKEEFRTALAEAIKTQPDAALAQDPATDPAKPAEAELEAFKNPVGKIIDSLDNLGGQGLPLGSALVGGFFGLTSTALINAFVPPKNDDVTVNFMNPAAKVAAAWASVNLLDKAVGKPAARFMAGWLLFDAARLVLPIDAWVAKIVALVKKPAAASPLSQYRAEQIYEQYRLGNDFNHQLPSTPQGQLLPGFGGVGHDQLAAVVG